MKGAMVRTFVALEVPEEVRRIVAEAQRYLAKVGGAGVSWPKPEGIHLTLRFLGDVAQDRIDEVVSEVDRAAAASPPLSLTARGMGGFPDLRRPRVVWIGVEGGEELMRLQADISRALAQFGGEERERFHPHLTVGRVKYLKPGSRLPQAAAEYQPPSASWTAREVAVMSSRLTPTGAIYSALGVVKLGGSTL